MMAVTANAVAKGKFKGGFGPPFFIAQLPYASQ